MLATVALPVYNNRDICWLTLEGLCRQENAGDWELIVCEENNGKHCGVEFFEGYKNRLFESGCIRIVYLPVTAGRFALSQKWKYMATKAQGKAFMLQGSDDYPDPRRIAETKKAVDEGYHWYQVPRYYCFLRNYGLYEYNDQKHYMSTGIDKGTLTELVLKCDSREIKRGVDTWLLRNVWKILKEPRIKSIHYEEYKGVSTTGFNTISTNRDMPIWAQVYPYVKVEKTLSQILPAEVAKKLESL
jgi:hypothetical protein